ncbi:MAG TPA: hypothetical protein VMU49_06810 [Candidatus Acidoferrales bacterium]|nr:hypothetical protein [Candidatus Acidoferrales bacterium]
MLILEVLAVILAWLGGAAVLLSSGRRGIALGIGAAGLGLGLSEFAAGAGEEAILVLLGALLAAGLRLRDGGRGWGTLGPGSTPGLISALAALLGPLLLAVYLLPGRAEPALLCGMVVTTLGAMSVMATGERQLSLAGAALVAFGVGAMAGPEAAIYGAVGATLVSMLPASAASRPQP